MPEQHTRRYAQQTDDTCSIAAARMVIREQTGRDVPEAELARRAQELGAYTPGQGTNTASAGYHQLLAEYGVDTAPVETNLPALSQPLSDAPRGLISPDSPVIMGVRQYADSRGDVVHSVVVDGIHTQPNGQVVYRVNDPWYSPSPTGNTYWETQQSLAARSAGGTSVVVLPHRAAAPPAPAGP